MTLEQMIKDNVKSFEVELAIIQDYLRQKYGSDVVNHKNVNMLFNRNKEEDFLEVKTKHRIVDVLRDLELQEA